MQYRSDSAISWIFPKVNSSVFALRATPGQEGWRLFCHVVYPPAFATLGITPFQGSMSTISPGFEIE
jgi:hypothetical protein